MTPAVIGLGAIGLAILAQWFGGADFIGTTHDSWG